MRRASRRVGERRGPRPVGRGRRSSRACRGRCRGRGRGRAIPRSRRRRARARRRSASREAAQRRSCASGASSGRRREDRESRREPGCARGGAAPVGRAHARARASSRRGRDRLGRAVARSQRAVLDLVVVRSVVDANLSRLGTHGNLTGGCGRCYGGFGLDPTRRRPRPGQAHRLPPGGLSVFQGLIASGRPATGSARGPPFGGFRAWGTRRRPGTHLPSGGAKGS